MGHSLVCVVRVTDEFAPSWWVLADAEGNEACVCTWQGEF
jgi:4a-hydroxytetrahydrobiopterin dehydratase